MCPSSNFIKATDIDTLISYLQFLFPSQVHSKERTKFLTPNHLGLVLRQAHPQSRPDCNGCPLAGNPQQIQDKQSPQIEPLA